MSSIPERGYGFATGSFRGGITNITNSAGTHSKDQPVNELVASVAMIGGIVTGSGQVNLAGAVTGAYFNIATAVGSNTPVSGGTKLTDARTFLSASFRGHSSSLIQAMNYLEARITDAGSVDLADIDIDGGTDIGEAIVDADLFIVDNGADGTNRKTQASRIKTYVGAEAGSFSLANLDIDGGTDIGEAIVDADLLIIDNGADGTNRKTAASRIKTYVGAAAGAFDIGHLDIDGGTDIGEALVDADLLIVDNGAGGTNRKTAMSRIKTYVGAAAGAFSIDNLDIDGGTDIGAALADADLFVVDDGAGGTNRKLAASRILTYVEAGLDNIGNDLSLNDNNITNVGDINADSISVDDASVGLNVDFSGGNNGTGLITLADNQASALTILEGTGVRLNSYITFTTTNGSEVITVSQPTTFGTGTVTIPAADINGGAIDETTIGANTAAAGTFTTLAASTMASITGKSYLNGAVARFGQTGSSNLEIAGYGSDGTSGFFRLAVSGGMLQVQEV